MEQVEFEESLKRIADTLIQPNPIIRDSIVFNEVSDRQPYLANATVLYVVVKSEDDSPQVMQSFLSEATKIAMAHKNCKDVICEDDRLMIIYSTAFKEELNFALDDAARIRSLAMIVTKIAKQNGLEIPVIYNTNGYENIETLKMLEGYIDIYLPDLKYYSDNLVIQIIELADKSYSSHDIVKEYIIEADCFICIYDITNINSVRELIDLVKNYEQYSYNIFIDSGTTICYINEKIFDEILTLMNKECSKFPYPKPCGDYKYHSDFGHCFYFKTTDELDFAVYNYWPTIHFYLNKYDYIWRPKYYVFNITNGSKVGACMGINKSGGK